MMNENEEIAVENEVSSENVKKVSKRIALDPKVIENLSADLVRSEKTSFFRVGPKGGTSAVYPKSESVSRFYFYGPEESVPSHPAITLYTKEERKSMKLGGIVAEVDFDRGLESATEAVALLLQVVRTAPAPLPKEKKVRPKKEKSDDSEVVEPTVVDEEKV